MILIGEMMSVCGVDACSSEQPDNNNNNNKLDTSIHDPSMSMDW